MKQLIIILCAFLLVSQAHAQAFKGQKTANIWYNYAMPLGDFKNNVASLGTPRAATVELMWHLNPQFQLGLSGGFANFYQKNDRAVYKMEDGSDISAVMTNNVQLIPILLNAVYYPVAPGTEGKMAKVQPFVQLGAGAALTEYERLLGQFSNISNNKINFAAKAGGGIKIPFGKFQQNGVLAGMHYNYSGFKQAGVNNINYVTGGIGLSFGLFD